MEYLIEIKETLSKQVNVEADSAEEAICQVKKQYLDSKIILTADDFVDYKIDTIKDLDFGKINCK
ncbi:MAG: DpnD/PcfM family protein [Bacteroidales bacterium]|nr:DpnD/PcfM family protein [Bacteroidales bacterium]